MNQRWRLLALWLLPIGVVLLIGWQVVSNGGINGLSQDSNGTTVAPRNAAVARMSYGRFLDYVEAGRVTAVDIYDGGRNAVIEAVDPDLDNRVQRLRVDLPGLAPELINTLKSEGISFDIHPPRTAPPALGVLGNLAFPLLLIGALIFLARRNSNMPGGPGQAMQFGKSKARFMMEAETGVMFDDVAGVTEAKQELQEVVTFLKQPERFTSVGAQIPRGLLLVGPPGTGKTLLAKAIAGEAGVPFFSLSGSEFVEMFVGVGASRVRDLFKKAKENSPCLIFIDEIDAVGRQRGAGIGGGNDEREQTLNQLLTEMDGFEENSGVILLAATNRADVLDAALLRPGRFDRRIDVGLPDRRGREAILAVHARTRPLDDAVSLSDWASRTPGFSGADLANLLNEAAILTARQNMLRIGQFQLEGALERITMGLSNRPLQDSAKKRLIAYHEVGHALVASLLPAANAVDKVTILPRGGAGGYTRFMPDEEVLDSGLITRSSCLADLVVALGGRAAEQVVFGSLEITQGASGDLQMVAQLAREMVTRFGFSSLGPMALEGPGTEVFLGRDWFNQRPGYAESTGQAIDAQIRQLAKSALAQAIALLEPRRELMDQLVDVLIAEETINGDRFRDIAGLP